jgi:hypothetical protein
VPPAIVQYLVFAIMFCSAPAVGVVASFAQSVDASAQCNFDWTPVIQTSKHFVVRGGEIPFEVTEPFTFLHLALLVATLAGLVVMWRLVGRFVDQSADDQHSTPPTPSTIIMPDNCMFTVIYPRTVEDTSYRTSWSFRDRHIETSGACYSTRLGTNPTA